MNGWTVGVNVRCLTSHGEVLEHDNSLEHEHGFDVSQVLAAVLFFVLWG